MTDTMTGKHSAIAYRDIKDELDNIKYSRMVFDDHPPAPECIDLTSDGTNSFED